MVTYTTQIFQDLFRRLSCPAKYRVEGNIDLFCRSDDDMTATEVVYTENAMRNRRQENAYRRYVKKEACIICH